MLDMLWPIGARTDENGELWLGDCAVSELAKTFGTPLYVFDEATLRTRARTYQEALRRHYPATAQAAYASKAYLCLAIAQLFEEEGLDLDVVSGGELHVALQAGFPAERIHFHGNNKSPDELAQALEAGIGRIVVDNFHELALLTELVASAPPASSFQLPVRIWLRLSPGVQAHTHAHIQTGQVDTKFGFDIKSGDAERAVVAAMQTPGLSLVGLHAHIGSQIYEAEDHAVAAAKLIAFAAQMRDRHGFALQELSPGGGWGVPMTESDPSAPIEPYIATLCGAIVGVVPGSRSVSSSSGAGAGTLAGRAGCCGGLHRGRAQGDSRRAHLRLGGWRHGRQHPPGTLRRAVHGPANSKSQIARCLA